MTTFNPYAPPRRCRFYLAGVFTGITVAALLVVLAGVLGYLPARAAASHEVRLIWSGSPSVSVTVTDADDSFTYRSDAHTQAWTRAYPAGERVRLKVRDLTGKHRNEVWCELEVDGRFVVHKSGRTATCEAEVGATK